MAARDELLKSLTDLIAQSDSGDRLPTVRELMKRHGIGQSSVQDVFATLKDRGLITSHVGRGSYVVKPAGGASGSGETGDDAGMLASILILANVNMNERCARVQALIVEQMQTSGTRVVQMSYSDTDHLLSILQGLPPFDAVVLQSHYESIPVRLLAALQQKVRAIVIDGLAVSGVDVDRMGIDWQEALTLAIDHLVETGRRKLSLVTLDSHAQPIEQARRFFKRVGRWKSDVIETSVHRVPGLIHPTQNTRTAFSNILPDIEAGEPDALVFLGLSDTAGVDAALAEHGLTVPDDLSVVVLGHVDVAAEHLDRYTIAGGSHEEGARSLVEMVKRRRRSAELPPQIRYLSVRLDVRASTLPDDTGPRPSSR